jgi:hypothetical protein
MEQSSRILKPKRFTALKGRIEKALAAGVMSADFHLTLFKAMNPKAMSPADIDTLNEFENMYP